MNVGSITVTATSQGAEAARPAGPSSSHVDGGDDRHARPERERRIGRLVEHDLDRHALHDLDGGGTHDESVVGGAT
jgi:hypothetical protein